MISRKTTATSTASILFLASVNSVEAFQLNKQNFVTIPSHLSDNHLLPTNNIIANHNEETSLHERRRDSAYRYPFEVRDDPINLFGRSSAAYTTIQQQHRDLALMYESGRRKTSSSQSKLAAATLSSVIDYNDFYYNNGYDITALPNPIDLEELYSEQKRKEIDSDEKKSLFQSTIKPIISTSLLITGNTIGAGALVLPDIVKGPGLVASTGLFLGAYVLNLISGLLLAEVAIKQYESSTQGGDDNDMTEGSTFDVPSSFKEFAENNLPMSSSSSIVSNGIAGVSIFVNACVLAFNLIHVGSIGGHAFGDIGTTIDPTFASLGFASALTALFVFVDMEGLSNIASMAVTGLFITLGSLLLPGLANISDPINTFFNTAPTAEATGGNMMESLAHAAPIILTSMVYQNIVPPVTKMLNYDRFKSTASIMIGSAIPTLIYLLWCFVNIGGGLDASALGSGGLMTAFSLTTIIGSSIACVMSISEEVETFFGGISNDNEKDNTVIENDNSSSSNDGGKGIFYSKPSVCLSVVVPLLAGISFASSGDNGCIDDLLRYAGSYGSPLLYGILPVVMAYTQRQKLSLSGGTFFKKEEEDKYNTKDKTNPIQNLVPGGIVSLGLLGTTFGSFMFEEMTKDFSNLVSNFA